MTCQYDHNEQLEFIEREIDSDKKFFTGRRNFNRKVAFHFSIIAASFSAVSTVLIGASEKLGPGWLRIIAMVTSGAATVFSVWEGFFHNRKLWVLNNTTLAGLYELQKDIAFRKANSSEVISKQEVEEFYNKYKKIVQHAEDGLKAAYSL